MPLTIYDLTKELLVSGYIRDIQKSITSQKIPKELNDIVFAYHKTTDEWLPEYTGRNAKLYRNHPETITCPAFQNVASFGKITVKPNEVYTWYLNIACISSFLYYRPKLWVGIVETSELFPLYQDHQNKHYETYKQTKTNPKQTLLSTIYSKLKKTQNKPQINHHFDEWTGYMAWYNHGFQLSGNFGLMICNMKGYTNAAYKPTDDWVKGRVKWLKTNDVLAITLNLKKDTLTFTLNGQKRTLYNQCGIKKASYNLAITIEGLDSPMRTTIEII